MSGSPDNSPVTREDLKSLETRVDLKLSSLRAWGVAALLGGQALAGVLAALVVPKQTVELALSVARTVLPL